MGITDAQCARTHVPYARSGGPDEVRRSSLPGSVPADAYAENDDPQPQPPVAFGFLKVKPEPCIEVV